MEHPEKELFDEVRALKNQIIEVKERVFKLESSYQQQVEEVEEKYFQNHQSEDRVKLLEASQQEILVLSCNNVDFPLSKELVNQNCFFSFKLENLTEDSDKKIFIDEELDYFEALLSILRYGHLSNFISEQEFRSESIVKSVLRGNIGSDKGFHEFLKRYFDFPNFSLIVSYLDLECCLIPDDANDCFEKFSIEGKPYINEVLNAFKITDPIEFSIKNEDDGKAVFIGTSASLIIKLTKMIRTKIIYLRPFMKNKSVFSHTNGYGTANLYTSLDGVNYTNHGIIPSSFNSDNNNIVEKYLEKIISFNYIKIHTPSANFSVSTIAFKLK